MTVFELMEDEKEEGGEEEERGDGREGGGEKVNQSFQPLSSTVVNTPLIQSRSDSDTLCPDAVSGTSCED